MSTLETVQLQRALGAQSIQLRPRLAVYVPEKDRHGTELGNQRAWVLATVRVFSALFGGATVQRGLEGAWVDPSGNVVTERLVLVYAYVTQEAFEDGLPMLRAHLHAMGRDTDQGEILAEFAGHTISITEYDPDRRTMRAVNE